jgi:predicted transcriptional regulator
MGARRPHLDGVLFGKVRRGILGMLFTHPRRSLRYSELVRAVDAGHGAVDRELRRLTAVGILSKSTDRRRTYYAANPDCPIYRELRQLFRQLASHP